MTERMIQEWRKHCEPQMSIAAEKGAKILAMAVVEDFIYLNRSSSTSTLQVLGLTTCE